MVQPVPASKLSHWCQNVPTTIVHQWKDASSHVPNIRNVKQILTASPFNPFSAKDVLIDFTLSNARRFYSSKGNSLALKGLNLTHTGHQNERNFYSNKTCLFWKQKWKILVHVCRRRIQAQELKKLAVFRKTVQCHHFGQKISVTVWSKQKEMNAAAVRGKKHK